MTSNRLQASRSHVRLMNPTSTMPVRSDAPAHLGVEVEARPGRIAHSVRTDDGTGFDVRARVLRRPPPCLRSAAVSEKWPPPSNRTSGGGRLAGSPNRYGSRVTQRSGDEMLWRS